VQLDVRGRREAADAVRAVGRAVARPERGAAVGRRGPELKNQLPADVGEAGEAAARCSGGEIDEQGGPGGGPGAAPELTLAVRADGGEKDRAAEGGKRRRRRAVRPRHDVRNTLCPGPGPVGLPELAPA